MFLNKLKKSSFLIAALALAGSAQAAVDTGAVTSAVTDAGAAIAVVGAAVLVVHVGMKVYKWIQRAL